MIKKIAPDKWKHFFVGIIMGAVLQSSLWYLFDVHHIAATVGAFIMVIIISYGFELFSLVTHIGYYDVMDAVAGIIGGTIGMAVTLLFQL